jgi:hypothetical protein
MSIAKVWVLHVVSIFMNLDKVARSLGREIEKIFCEQVSLQSLFGPLPFLYPFDLKPTIYYIIRNTFPPYTARGQQTAVQQTRVKGI